MLLYDILLRAQTGSVAPDWLDQKAHQLAQDCFPTPVLIWGPTFASSTPFTSANLVELFN